MTDTLSVRSLGLITLALLSPLLVACGGGDDDPGATFTSSPTVATPASVLSDAYDTCLENSAFDRRKGAAAFSDSALQEDVGEPVIITSDLVEPADALEATSCILTESDAPVSILANMQSTTALMGRQSADYDGITVQWSYSAATNSGGFQATLDTD